jgi:hypothetical protein
VRDLPTWSFQAERKLSSYTAVFGTGTTAVHVERSTASNLRREPQRRHPGRQGWTNRRNSQRPGQFSVEIFRCSLGTDWLARKIRCEIYFDLSRPSRQV